MRRMEAISIVGPSGSGKTTLIERLIPALRSHSLRVGALKHSHHGRLDLDRPGKDTHRMREAGAEVVCAVAGGLYFHVERCEGSIGMEEVAARLVPARLDVLLVESFRSARLPCILVVEPGGEADGNAAAGRAFLVVGRHLERDDAADPPRLNVADVGEIARRIAARVGRAKEA